MDSKKIIIATVLYYPNRIFERSYLELIGLGFNLEIWCNSQLDERIMESLNILERSGGVVHKHYENHGLGRVINHYFELNVNKILFFIDQDTKINPIKFQEYLERNWTIIKSNFLTYGFNHQNPKFFFTNSGAFFNLSETRITIPKHYFVELIDYFIYFRIREQNLQFSYVKVDYIDHYSFQNNINLITQRKFYSITRKKEVLFSSIRLILSVIISSKLSIKLKIQFITHILKNVINIIR